MKASTVMAAATEAPARRPRRPSSAVVIVIATAVFLSLFAFLAYRLALGHDPALGGGQASTTAQQPVILRKIIERRVITSGGGSGGSWSSSSGAVSAAPVLAVPAPVTSSS
jgi:hypothetical protein